MKEKNVKTIIEDLSEALSLSYLAKKYFRKDKSWLYHKLHEDKVNGVQYKFTDEDIQVLIDALDDVSQLIASTKKRLVNFKQDSERGKGRYLTSFNPFNHPLFWEWYALLPCNTVLLEPFAGACGIPSMLYQMGIHNNWTCFDIEPMKNANYKVTKRDTLKNFPVGYKAIVTNPPYLAKNSAIKRGLQYPMTKHDDIYKLALDLMLRNSQYVAAILPESFINSGLSQERLYGIVSLNCKMFQKTDCPVCLALFIPEVSGDYCLYVGEKYLGTYSQLNEGALFDYVDGSVSWKMNEPSGTIGVVCFYGIKGESIRFVVGDTINPSNIKLSSRSVTRIGGLPSTIDLPFFINKCNDVLAQYRKDTCDVFLTSFKGLRKDGKYRRRIDFKTVKCILNKAMSLIS